MPVNVNLHGWTTSISGDSDNGLNDYNVSISDNDTSEENGDSDSQFSQKPPGMTLVLPNPHCSPPFPLLHPTTFK